MFNTRNNTARHNGIFQMPLINKNNKKTILDSIIMRQISNLCPNYFSKCSFYMQNCILHKFKDEHFPFFYLLQRVLTRKKCQNKKKKKNYKGIEIHLVNTTNHDDILFTAAELNRKPISQTFGSDVFVVCIPTKQPNQPTNNKK